VDDEIRGGCMKIGEEIKKRRLELNMTQEELASELHVSRSTVSNWEVNRNYPDIQLIVHISKMLVNCNNKLHIDN
jgi:transcriptional regulator with XRE-family HTH domain